MPITRDTAAEQLVRYLRQQLSLERLVAGAEDQMMESQFADNGGAACARRGGAAGGRRRARLRPDLGGLPANAEIAGV